MHKKMYLATRDGVATHRFVVLSLLLSLVPCSILVLPAGFLLPANAASQAQDEEMSAFPVTTASLGEREQKNGFPSSVAVNPATGTVYVANRNSDTVYAIDPLTNSIVKTIPVGFGPADVAVDPGTNSVYVAVKSTNTISVIDGASNEVAATINFADRYYLGAVHGVAVNTKTNKVYALIDDLKSQSAYIAAIDGPTRKVEGTFKVGDLKPDYDVGATTRAIAVNSRTNTAYVTKDFGSLLVIDLSKDQVAADIALEPASSIPNQVEVNEETNMVYVTVFSTNSVSVVDGSTNRIVKKITSVPEPQGLAIDDKRNAVYVITSASEVLVIDGSSYSVRDRVPVGAFPEGAAFNPGNSRLYVTNAFSNSVSVIDTATTAAPAASPGEGWETARITGKFVNSLPPRPDQVFNVYYRAVNGKVESFNTTQGIVAKVAGSGSSKGLLEVLFPRNFPYTNSGEGIGTFEIYDKSHDRVIIDGARRSTTDCFFVFSIPFEGAASGSEIELRWAYLAWERPYHGDAVPAGCIPQTLVEVTPAQLKECDALGIDARDCSESAISQQQARNAALLEQEMRRAEDERNATNNLMYMVGIGAAIAGVVAFVTLRKRVQ
jgi:YVTN family beta-propeller protein